MLGHLKFAYEAPN